MWARAGETAPLDVVRDRRYAASGQVGVSAAGRVTRALAWALLALLAFAYYAILQYASAPTARFLGMEFIYCIPIVATVGLGVRSSFLSDGTERWFWAFLAGANAVLFVCELLLIVWVFAIEPAGPPRVCWPFHVLHGIAAVLFIALILSMSRVLQAPITTKLRWALDATSVVLIASSVVLAFYILPIMAPAGAPLSHVLLGTAYPVFGLMMLAGTLANVVGLKIDRWRAWDRLTAISLAVYACAISLWPLWYGTATQTSRNYERGLLDLVQFGGHWLLMMAAVYRLTEPSLVPLRPLARPVVSKDRWSTIAVPVASMLAIPVVAWLAFTSTEDRQAYVIYVGVFTALTFIALARSAVVALENGALFHQSVTDPLTGLHNHRFFRDRLEQEVGESIRYGAPVSLVVIDLDAFGAFNRVHGHSDGDRLLAQVGMLIRGAAPGSATTARLGGDEYAVILPDCDPLEALIRTRRILDVVCIEAGVSPGSVSFSAGLAACPTHADSAEMLLKLADGALFDAKSAEPGSIIVFDEHRVQDLSPTDRIARLEDQKRVSSVRALAAVLSTLDDEPRGGVFDIAILAADVGRELELAPDVVRRIENAGLLLDVGTLQRAGESPPSSRVSGRELAMRGQRILTAAGLEELIPIVRSTRERWDGTGVPDGLAAEEIPIEARVLAVCSAYFSRHSDAGEDSSLEAIRAIRADAGTRFDLGVVRALERIITPAR